MPNTKPPITTTEQALAYRERILAEVPSGQSFTPLMTLYMTDKTTSEEVTAAKATGLVHAVKLYPRGASTNSDSGVTDLPAMYPVMRTMAKIGLPLLLHGEVTDPETDIFDKEPVFLKRVLEPLLAAVPELRVVLEHITTAEAVAFVEAAPANLGATITVHHLLYNRNALFKGGVRPHMFCLPVLKHEHNRRALVRAATSGSAKFFVGTDSAPHSTSSKHAACGCAGVFTAHCAVELYAEAFDAAGALDKLEGFMAHHGPDFYKLPRSTARRTLTRTPWVVPAAYDYTDADGASDGLIPLRAGESVYWRLSEKGSA